MNNWTEFSSLRAKVSKTSSAPKSSDRIDSWALEHDDIHVQESEIAQYFTLLTGLIPTPDQVALMNAIIDYDRVEASAGRQSGKTITVSVATMYLAYKYHIPLRVLLLSPQDNIVYSYMLSFFRSEHRDELTKNLVGGKSSANIVPLTGFQLASGSRVKVAGITDRSIRGNPADVVIVDEAYLVPRASILTAMGCLSGDISKFILLSTPGPSYNDSLKEDSLFMKWLDDPEYKHFAWSNEGLPWHNTRLANTKKKELKPAEYASEVLGRAPTEQELEQSKDLIGEVILITVPTARQLERASTRK